eukprot:TRINITY_DN1244_c0_g1_i12.p1 TRINITY_DN1244_c0_g1~~TRINITY_DN1244_c0_g1_i12.p1  ORF type:complete len:2425 (-),score=375.50 TRINITY_DN1244_c0_g1_i12:344-7618(-)
MKARFPLCCSQLISTILLITVALPIVSSQATPTTKVSTWDYLYEAPISSSLFLPTYSKTHLYQLHILSILRNVYIFDLERKEWFSRETSGEISSCVQMEAHVADQNTIFAHASCDGSGISLFYQLSLATFTWTILPCVPGSCISPRSKPYLFLHGGILHLCGGEILGPDLALGDVWYYEKETTKWISVNLPGKEAPSLNSAGYGYYDGKLYSIGGQQKSKVMETGLWIFSFETRQWERIELGIALGVSRRAVWSSNALWIFASNQTLQTPSSCIYAVTKDSISGAFNRTIKVENSCLDPIRSIPPTRLMGRSDFYIFPYDDRLVFFGGAAEVRISKKLTAFDRLEWEWSSMDYFPVGRMLGFVGDLGGEKYLLFGGNYYGHETAPLNDMWTFSTASRRWECWSREHFCEITNTSCAPLFYSSAAALYNSTLYIIGGSPGLGFNGNLFRVFSIANHQWSALFLTERESGKPLTSINIGVGYTQQASSLWIFLGICQKCQPPESPKTFQIDLQRNLVEISNTSNPFPSNRLFPACTYSQGRFYIANGYIPGEGQKPDVWSYDPAARQWSFISRTNILVSEQTSSGILIPYKDPLLLMVLQSYLVPPFSVIISHGKPLQRIPLAGHGLGTSNSFSFMRGQSAILFSTWRMDAPSIMVSRIDLDKLFCSSTTEIQVADQFVLEDGSGNLEYMLGTNCTWNISGASWIDVDFLDVGQGASVAVEATGFSIPYIPSQDIRNATSSIILGASDIGKTIRMDSEFLQIRFVVSETASTRQGFKLTLTRCPKGFVLIHKICTCPPGSFISFAGDCIESHNMSPSSTPWSINVATDDPRISSYSAYLGNSAYWNGSIYLLNGLRNLGNLPKLPYNKIGKILKMGTAGPFQYRLRQTDAIGEIPDLRYGACESVILSRLWLFGGVSLGAFSPYVFSLDLESMVWQKRAQSPFDEVEGQICVADQKLVYLVGGVKVTEGRFESSYIYDTEKDMWVDLPGFVNGPKISHASGAIHGGDIFIFGGWNGRDEVQQMWIYRKEKQFWTEFDRRGDSFSEKNSRPLSALSISRQQACSWVVGTELHLFGGLRGGSSLNDLLVIDLDREEIVDYQPELPTPIWPPRKPQARFGASCLLINNIGYLIAGATDVLETAHDVWMYLPEMRSWINNSLSTLPTARRDHGFSFGPFGTFLVFGGSTKQSRTAYLNDLWSYTPENNTWLLLSGLYRSDTAPAGRDMMGFGFLENKAFVFGGRLENMVADKKLWTFSLVDKKWSFRPLLPSIYESLSLQSGLNSVPYDGKMIFTERQVSEGRLLSRISVYTINMISGSIYELIAANQPPVYRARAGIAIWKETIYLISGIGADNSVSDEIWTFSLGSRLWSKLPVSIDQRRTLPAFASYGRFVVIVGEEMQVKRQSQVLDAESGVLIKSPLSIPQEIVNLSGHACLWNENGLWLYGGQTSSIFSPEIVTFHPATCGLEVVKVVGRMQASLLEDGSFDAPYLSPNTCTWEIQNSDHVEIEYSLAGQDSLVLSQLNSRKDSTKLMTLQGNGSLSYHLQTPGFRIELKSWYNNTEAAPGFMLWHSVCPSQSTYQTKVGCICNQGYEMDSSKLDCIPCEKSKCQVDEDERSKDIYLLEIVLPVAIIALLATVIGFVSKYYRGRIRGHRVKYERRIHLSDPTDFILGFEVQTERLPSVFRGTMKRFVVEIDVIRNIDHPIEDIESGIDRLSSFRHPNIQLYMGACFMEDSLWIAMEWMGVGSLSSVLKSHTEWNWRKKIDCLLQIANGLAFLHSASPPVVHGNLSSAFILIDQQSHVKISGLPRVLIGAHMDVSSPLGKVPWCAPEAIFGSILSASADSYSFGMIAWEIASNKTPYEGIVNKLDLLTRIEKDGLRPQIPEGCLYDIRLIIEQCWRRSPESRPTATQIIDKLKAIQYDESGPHGALLAQESIPAPLVVGTYVLSTKIWNETLLWNELTDKMPDIIASFLALVKQIFLDHEIELREEFNGVLWGASFNLETVVRVGACLLSSLEKLQWSFPWTQVYGINSQTDPIQGLRVQLVIAGEKQAHYSGMVPGVLQRSILNNCMKYFVDCEGGQMIMPKMLMAEMDSKLVHSLLIRNIQSFGDQEALVEILPMDMKSRSLYFGQLSTMKLSAPRLPGAFKKESTLENRSNWEEDYDDFNLDWGVAKSERALMVSCSIPSVWSSRSKAGRPIIMRKFSVQNPGFQVQITLKHDIFRSKKWDHPNLSSVSGYCVHYSVVTIAVDGASFYGLDQYIKTLRVAEELNAFRLNVACQVKSALQYLHQLEPAQPFNGIDWRNIAVFESSSIRLGFPGHSPKVEAYGKDSFIRICCQAPEVISRGKVGLQGDVYGFGILLWEISTLREAYTEMDDIELAKFLYDGGLPEFSSITNHDLRRTIISACQYDPDERLHIKEIHPTAEWWTL